MAIQVVMSLSHRLQSVLGTTDLVPKKSLALQRLQRQAELRHVLGAVGSGVSSPVCVAPVIIEPGLCQPKADGQVSM